MPKQGRKGPDKPGRERQVQKAKRDIVRASKVITNAASALSGAARHAPMKSAGRAWAVLAGTGEMMAHSRTRAAHAVARPHYRMEIEWSDEDRAYVVRVPDLPGCVTHGHTYIDAARMGEEAIEAWLAGARHWGRSIPAPGAAGGR